MREAPYFSDRILACLQVPGHDHDCRIELADDALRCVESGELYPFIEGIPSLLRQDYAGHEVTRKVQAFYEESPFPSYEGLEEYAELVNKGYRNPFTTRLLNSIGYNKLILECGCGTGQLSQFLQLNNNHALGADITLASLSLAVEHKRRNALQRSQFCQMDIFELALKDASFDVVIAHGVFPTVYDPARAFSEVVRKVKPGGIVIVGVYNYFARVPTWVRAKLIGILGPRIDYVVRTQIRDPRKAEIWVRDQYYHPQETWQSIDEVMGWFEVNDVEFLSCSPPILGTSNGEADNLFASTGFGSKGQRILTQLGWLWTIAREGALFDLIGRRKP